MTKVELERANDRLIITSSKATVEEQKLASRIHRARPGLLPPVTRWVNGSQTAFVIERAPRRQQILFQDLWKEVAKMRNNHEIITISLPWQVYLVTLNPWRENHVFAEMYIFVRNSPLSQLTDQLHYMPLPNIAPGLTCLPEAIFKREGRSNAEIAQSVIALYWSSGFNKNVHEWATYNAPDEMQWIETGREALQLYENTSVPDIVTWNWQAQFSVGHWIQSRMNTPLHTLHGDVHKSIVLPGEQ